ncbi:MAG TPA: penicillin-binding transpeptidase domain-containing protein [Solirubrobacteraceae bacterium]|jgi:cell division protein FtsI/penicillin-binding protein 2|nr:penicillin-binding transpeptidase domain-containing protein [Solirubrobacteraceae bacterium]
MIFAGTLIAGALAVIALLMATGGPPPQQTAAQRFVAAWVRGDFSSMYGDLSEAQRRVLPLAKFAADYRAATATATATAFRHGKVPRPKGGVVRVPMLVTTRIFGAVRATLPLKFSGDGDDTQLDWSANLVFPGLAAGEQLSRDTQMPARADILARDGTPLAQGAARSSPIPDVASSIVGSLGAPPPDHLAALRGLGYPSGATVGTSGLERVFEAQVAGRPGGVLRAGTRVLARTLPVRAAPVHTSIDPDVQRAAIAAKGDRLGGVAVVRPSTGEILALAGLAFSGLQPPGSTFKIVTLTGVLEANLGGPNSQYPYETKATIEGRDLQNANGESCGGSLRQSFAQSCNSVFAPLGVKLGAQRLVQAAEQFGFNRDLGIPGAAMSTIPQPETIGDDLAVGSSAIGQGRVQATALQMAWVAATIAGHGQRPRLTLQRGLAPQPTQVLAPRIARVVGQLMESVVTGGTGTAAQIPGVRVAGKTGTAELKDTSKPECVPDPTTAPDATATTTPDPATTSCPPPQPNDPTDTDAWFAAYAPANAPRVAVGVLLVASGAGADTAAPAARGVLLAGLKATS